MNKNVRWKLVVIVGVVALAVWAFYPPQQKVSLGLDLKGGVHLVMRVRTDEALKIETDTTVERLRETLSRAGVQYIEPRGDEPHGVRGHWRPESAGVPPGRCGGGHDIQPDAGRRRARDLHDASEHRDAVA